MKKIQGIITRTVLIVVFILLFFCIQGIITPHPSVFYQEPPNSIEILALGSSHAYCSINPALFWSQYGVTSYDFCAPQQNTVFTYYYFKEALKTQSPRVVLLEVVGVENEGVYQSAAIGGNSAYQMKPSLNRYFAVWNGLEPDSRLTWFFPMLYYHGGWARITKNNFIPPVEEDAKVKGHVVKFEYNDQTEATAPDDPIREISERNLKYLMKMINLAKKNDIELILMRAPSAAYGKARRHYDEILADICVQNNVEFVNGNLLLDQIGLEKATDFLDFNHLNSMGAEKFTKYLGDHILTKYDLSDKMSNIDYSSWNEAAKKYFVLKEDHENIMQITSQ